MSHIIPEFLFKALYDATNHKFIQISEIANGRKYGKGFREKLLCRQCEALLSKWESYAAHVFFRIPSIEAETVNNSLIIKNIDYCSFKLFQLSLIWRAGASSVPQFKTVDLGPHQETLRLMLLNEHPGSFMEYGCGLILTPAFYNVISKMMMLPQRQRIFDHICYVFIMGGLTWSFFVSSHMETFPHSDVLFIKEAGTLPIIIENRISAKFFERQFFEWKKSGLLSDALSKMQRPHR